MALRCSMFGCEYDGTEIERDRERRGSEVVLTVREYEECVRCGEIRLISENTGVTSAPGEDDDTDPAVADAAGEADCVDSEGDGTDPAVDAGASGPGDGRSPDAGDGSSDDPRNGGASDGPGGDLPIEEAEPDRAPATGVATALEDAEHRALEDGEDDVDVPDDDAVILDDPADETPGDGAPDDGDPAVEGSSADHPAVADANADGDPTVAGDDGDPAVQDADGDPAVQDADDPVVEEPTTGDAAVEESGADTPAVGEPTADPADGPPDPTASGAREGPVDDGCGDADPAEDDAVILDDGPGHAAWPTAGDGDDRDPQWGAGVAGDDGPAAASWHGTGEDADGIDHGGGDDGSRAASWHGTGDEREDGTGDHDHGEWPTAGSGPDADASSADDTGSGEWPTHAAEDEGWSATPDDDEELSVEVTGLTPGGGAGGADAGGSRRVASRTTTARDDGDRELVCDECGHGLASGRTALQAGDICPGCARGYLAERTTRNR